MRITRINVAPPNPPSPPARHVSQQSGGLGIVYEDEVRLFKWFPQPIRVLRISSLVCTEGTFRYVHRLPLKAVVEGLVHSKKGGLPFTTKHSLPQPNPINQGNKLVKVPRTSPPARVEFTW